MPAKLMHELRLDFVLIHSRAHELHCARVRSRGNLRRLAHCRNLGTTLVQAHVVQQVIKRDKFLRRMYAS